MSNIDRLRVDGTDYDIQSVVKVYDTIADMNADIANIPNGATVFVKENSPSGLEGDDELDPTSSNWVKNSAIAEAISTLSSDLASKITGVWTNITASSPSDKVDIIPTDQYRTSGYIIRGGLCFVNVSVVVTADTGDNSIVVLPSGVLPSPLRVYNGQYSTYKAPSWSSFGTPSNQIFAESLFQGGILYIRKAVAGDYTISFVYPVASP